MNPSATAAQTNGKTEAAARATGSVGSLLAELRELAATHPARAQRETWAWIEDLGRRKATAGLEELFSLGTVPEGLDGPTDGILVTATIQPVIDVLARGITSLWMPWAGKRFDAAARRGDNRIVESAALPAKLIWPRYSMRPSGSERAAFDFETAVEPGRIEPSVEVLKIDYAPVEQNPNLVIRRIRDELVELVPDTYLGRILWRGGDGSHSLIGYFALRQPAGS
jgi:hypothetical protein